MININNLPTMVFHFFEAPNKILITDENYFNIITAEIDEQFDNDFILDAKSFDLMKKLNTNRKIEVDKKQITITSNEGTYKCNHIERQKPNLHLDDIIYEHNFDLEELKFASKFVSNNSAQQILNGVLICDNGDIYATDSFKMYGSNKNTQQQINNSWSIPVKFIELIKNGNLKFTKNKVIYEDDYCVYGNVYAGKMPDLKKAFAYSSNGITCELKYNENLNLFSAESIYLKSENGIIKYVLNDIEKEFIIQDEYKGNDIEFKCNYKSFIQGITFSNTITVKESTILFGNNVLLCRMV